MKDDEGVPLSHMRVDTQTLHGTGIFTHIGVV